jgi:hypothetical protein
MASNWKETVVEYLKILIPISTWTNLVKLLKELETSLAGNQAAI